MSEPSETEAVGYKRPPSKTQFKPGQSGNPRGRPKRKVNMSESLNRALDQKIVVTELGKTLTGMEAFVHSTLNRVLQGDARLSRRSCVSSTKPNSSSQYQSLVK